MKANYKLSLKFFTETKNEEQLIIAYSEIESFMGTYEKYVSYFLFDPHNINRKYLSALSEQNKYNNILIRNAFQDEDIILLINDFKYRVANEIFGEGKFNFALYNYALEKVCEQERNDKDKEKIRLEECIRKVSILNRLKNSKLYFFITIGLLVITLSFVAMNYYLFRIKGDTSKFRLK